LIPRDEEVQVFVDLGLSFLQARAYLVLSSLGNAPIKAISKASNIARQDIYRITATLQQLGLVEKIIANPATFRATPLEDGISILLQRKEKEYDNLQIKTEKLVNRFQKSAFRLPTQIDDSQFLIISEGRLLGKTLDEKNKAVKKSLDVAGQWQSTRSALFDYELETFRRALKRGVRIRWVTETHEEDNVILKTLRTLQNNPLFEIRYFVPPIPLQGAIYDKKEVVMCIAIQPSSDITSISSNNPMFTKVAANYFEEIWNGASKDYFANTPKTEKNEILKPASRNTTNKRQR
jgi:sugar-specific transcriptional regulator TrmB